MEKETRWRDRNRERGNSDEKDDRETRERVIREEERDETRREREETRK